MVRPAAPARGRGGAGLARAVLVPLVLVAMLGAAGVLLGRIYSETLLPWLLLGAAAGSVGVGAAARRLPAWLVAPVSVLAMGVYTLWTIRLTAQRAELPGTLRELTADAVTNGIPRLLTAMIPVQPQPDTVLIPVAATWLAGLAATEVAVRGGRILLGYAPPTLLLAGAIYLVGPNAAPALTVALGYAALAAIGLAAGGHGGAAPIDGLAPGVRAAMRLRGAGGAAVALAVVAALTAAIAPQVAARIDTRPVDPRKYVTPPQLDSLDENPLSRISGWALAPQQKLLDVTVNAGAAPPTGTAIRLAVLSDYDGVTWRVGATYRSAGRVLPEPTGEPGTAGAPLRQQITVGDLSGRLLPAAATPTRIDGARVAYDPSTGTLIRPEGLQPGLRYDVTSVRHEPDVNMLPLADVPTGPAAARMLSVAGGVPDQIQRLAQQLNADHGTPYDRATAIEQFLGEHYRLVSDAPSGHAYPNLGFFLFGPRNAGGQRGTSEQFAASFALLARLTGLPTRVIVGFRTEQNASTVRGADGLAWPEVLFSGVGWVAFNPLPQPNTQPRPVEEDFRPKPEQSTPPPSEQPTGTVAPASTAPATAAVSAPRKGGLSTGTVVAGGGGGLLVLLVAAFAVTVPLLRRAQRRRRLTEGPPASRISGAWLEVTDALRLAGRPAQGYLSATEVAIHASTVAAPVEAEAPAGAAPAGGPAHSGGTALAVRPAAPVITDLADLVNAATFAPDATDAHQAQAAGDQAIAYVTQLRARRSWWRRVVWSLHPGPLRWHRR